MEDKGLFTKLLRMYVNNSFKTRIVFNVGVCCTVRSSHFLISQNFIKASHSLSQVLQKADHFDDKIRWRILVALCLW